MMDAAVFAGGERNGRGERQAKINSPAARCNISSIDIIPDRRGDDIPCILPGASTDPDEDPLSLCRGKLHAGRIGSLAQINIAELSAINDRFLAASREQGLQEGQSNNAGLRVACAAVDQGSKGITGAIDRLRSGQEQCAGHKKLKPSLAGGKGNGQRLAQALRPTVGSVVSGKKRSHAYRLPRRERKRRRGDPPISLPAIRAIEGDSLIHIRYSWPVQSRNSDARGEK